MDEMEKHDRNPVMKLAKKLGVHDEFMAYCEAEGREPDADALKEFLKSKGYTQDKLKKMLADKSYDESEEKSGDSQGGVTISITMGKGGKMPPAWS